MAYTCPKCGRTSHNPNDERHRYCGACHQFEDTGDVVPADLAFLMFLVQENGYGAVRFIAGRRWAGVRQLYATGAIVSGRMGDRTGIDERWCYHSIGQAIAALQAWDGKGEPAGWHRHLPSRRRVSDGTFDIDEDGKLVAAGQVYVRA